MEFKILYDSNDEISALRKQTFVIEKNVPEDIEFDGRDAEYMHFCLYDNDTLVACARINKSGDIIHAGRVAVKTELRGKGYGRCLFDYITEYAKSNGCVGIELGAIQTAVDFYKKIGFETLGDYYDEAGWPHIDMIKKIVG